MLPAVADAVEATRGAGAQRRRGRRRAGPRPAPAAGPRQPRAPAGRRPGRRRADRGGARPHGARHQPRARCACAARPRSPSSRSGCPSATTPRPTSPAGRLLLDRAGAVSPGWGTDPAEDAAVAATCVRLAGMPLALELAAARARLLDPATLLARLDTALLGGPARPAGPAAHHARHARLEPRPARRGRAAAAAAAGGLRRRLHARRPRGRRRAHRRPGRLLAGAAGVAGRAVAGDRRAGAARGSGCWSRSRSTPASLLVEAGEWEAAARAHAAHFLALAEDTGPRYRDGGPGGRPGPDRPRAPQPDRRRRADARRRRRAGRRPGWPGRCGSTGGCAATTPTGGGWPRAVLAHGGLPADVRARAALAAATMAFAMDDVDAGPGLVGGAAPAARGRRPGHRLANAVAGIGLVALAARRPRRPRGDGSTPRSRSRSEAGDGRRSGPGRSPTSGSGPWRCCWATPTRPSRASSRAWRPPAAAATGWRRTSRSTTSPRSSSPAASTPEAARHLEEGLRLSAGDRRPGQPGLPARRAGRHRGRRGHRVAGAAAARRRPGDPRDDRRRAATATTARTRRRSPRPPSEARRHLGTDRYDDALDAGRALSPDAGRRTWRSGSHAPRPDAHPHTTRTPRGCPWCGDRRRPTVGPRPTGRAPTVKETP